MVITCLSCPLPLNTFSIQASLNKYVWSYGRHHTAAPNLYNSLKNGGLDMYSVFLHNKSLKLKWISRLSQNTEDFWQTQVNRCFRLPIKEVLAANLQWTDLKFMLRKSARLPKFWQSVFKCWCEEHYVPITSCSLDRW